MKIGVFVFLTEHSLDPALLARRAEDPGVRVLLGARTPRRAGKNIVTLPQVALRHHRGLLRPHRRPLRSPGTDLVGHEHDHAGDGHLPRPRAKSLAIGERSGHPGPSLGGQIHLRDWSRLAARRVRDFRKRFPSPLDPDPEAVLAMKELWMKDEAEFHGGYYDFPRVRSFPKPGQAPHPPVILGGDSPNVFKRAAEWGDGWVAPIDSPMDRIRDGCAQLRRLAESNGRDPKGLGGHRLRPFGPVPGPPRSRRA